MRWSAAGHRRDFAWRSWKDRYRLLVAEVLLRQTRAETVAAFIPTFLRRYPTPKRLSLAREPEIARLIRPLGFARQRARQLRALAGQLVQSQSTLRLDQLRDLPGIGPYSAGMVAAATGTIAAAVDTNVARVVCRVFGVEPSHAEARKSKNVWEIALEVVAVGDSPAEITWAMLDLAALLCSQRRPQCSRCPLAARLCVYAASSISGRRHKRGRPHRIQSLVKT
jgi:A/G-specific adenine glycosylase